MHHTIWQKVTNYKMALFFRNHGIAVSVGVNFQNSCNQMANNSFRKFLIDHSPEYISVVPDYWLEQDQPVREVQIFIAIIFLIISLTGNTCQLLVLVAYCR